MAKLSSIRSVKHVVDCTEFAIRWKVLDIMHLQVTCVYVCTTQCNVHSLHISAAAVFSDHSSLLHNIFLPFVTHNGYVFFLVLFFV